jgi:hypothetical protein
MKKITIVIYIGCMFCSTLVLGQYLYNASGSSVGRMCRNYVYVALGSMLGRIEGNYIYDASGSLKGRIDNNYIYDSTGSLIGRTVNVDPVQAILFYFFSFKNKNEIFI